MKTRIEQVWDEVLEAARFQPITEGSYKLRRVDPDFRFNVFAGVDSSGGYRLLNNVLH